MGSLLHHCGFVYALLARLRVPDCLRLSNKGSESALLKDSVSVFARTYSSVYNSILIFGRIKEIVIK